MVRSWVVRLGLARDDGVSLSDDGVRELTELLTQNQVLPVLTRGEDPGDLVVQMTVKATGDTAARSAAERALSDRAHKLWATLGLPPFTITFLDVTQAATPIA